MAACVHVALALRLKYKNIGAPLLIFVGIWYDIYFLAAFGKIRDCVMEEEEFEDLED
jgi:hypothetical protein